MVPGTNLPTNGDTILEAVDAFHAVLIAFLKRGADPTDLVLAIMTAALGPIMAAPSPEMRADYCSMAAGILSCVPMKKMPTTLADHSLDADLKLAVDHGVPVRRNRHH